jgi:transglutaminase-like putative cysteine protease
MMKSYAQISSVPRTEEFIGYGDEAIYNTVAKMKSIIQESSKNPYIREWAKNIVAGVPVEDKHGEASAIFRFVQSNVRYTKDPMGWEYIQTPPVLLEDIRLYQAGKGERPIGDCDDMTVLSLSLLRAIGFPVALKVVSYNPARRFGHVYGLVNIKGEWVPFDTVRPDKYMGWEAVGATRVLEVKV